MGEISRWLNDNNKSIKETQLTPKILIDLIKNINNGKITGKIAKTYVDVMMKGTEIIEIMKKSGKKRISDKDKITKVVKEVLEENYKIVEDYKKNPKALQALIGKCMQKTKGQLDPKITKDIMLKLIKK
jgi:aspartyl-tRNA(Asn)/glutamyl-tRNA(Gln) amidotransferase subunit B